MKRLVFGQRKTFSSATEGDEGREREGKGREGERERERGEREVVGQTAQRKYVIYYNAGCPL